VDLNIEVLLTAVLEAIYMYYKIVQKKVQKGTDKDAAEYTNSKIK